VARARKRTAPRWQRRKDARPGELLEAALASFVERGFAATRLEDIAAHAGVSKATLYLYYASKEELLKAVVRAGILSALTDAEEQVERFAGDSGELLRSVVHGVWTKVGDTPLSGVPKLVFAECSNFPELARFYYTEVIQRVCALLGRILIRGVRRGEFRELDVDPTARALMGPLLLMLLWRHSFHQMEDPPLSSERCVDGYLRLALDGLRARASTERAR
jgi:AcrR family transcriptional regulator